MGFSVVAATGVMGVSFLVVVEIFTGSVLPTLTDVREAYNELADRTIEQLQTDIEVTNMSEVPWWDTAWNYRKLMVIDHNQVAADLSNLPVLVDITDSDLSTKAQPDGDDIAFVSGDNTTQYNHEIELYDSGTGHLVAWVNVTYLSVSLNTWFFMYYNNSGASNQENPTGVWDDNYHGVWHLNESSGTLFDSTSYDNDHTTIGGAPTYGETGQIDGAVDYDGDDDYTNCGDPADGSLDFGTGDFTIEAWVKTQETTTRAIIQKHKSQILPAVGYGMYIQGRKLGAFFANGKFGGYYALDQGDEIINDDSWHYLAAVFDRDSEGTLYVDGSVESETDISGGAGSTSNARPFEFCRNDMAIDADLFFNGTLDEVRMSNKVRSLAWIKTSYNTMNSPSTFISVEAEQDQTYSYLNVTVNNTGNTKLETSEFTMLVDGTNVSLVTVESYLFLEHETFVLVGVSNTGSRRLKVVTGNGIAEYDVYIF